MKRALEALERGEASGTAPHYEPELLRSGSAELHREIERTWALDLGVGLSFPPGVYRHRTVEDMNRQTESWRRANAARLRSLLSEETAPVPSVSPTPGRG